MPTAIRLSETPAPGVDTNKQEIFAMWTMLIYTHHHLGVEADNPILKLVGY